MRRPGATSGLLAVGLAIATNWISPALSWAQVGPTQARPLQVATKTFAPFVFSQGGRFSGFSIDLLDQISKRAGFSYQLNPVDTVGEQLHQVEDGQADLAVAGISITSARERAVDFSFPTYSSGLQVMVARSGSDTRPPSIIGAGIKLWRPVGAIFLLLFMVAHIAWLTEFRSNPEHFPRPYFRGVGEGLWWASVTLTTVGYGDRTPRSVMGRLLGIVWMLTAIALIANLTARITTAFTVQELRSSINGLDDLAGKRVATVAATTASDFLERRDLRPVEVDSISQAFQLLEKHAVDGVVFDAPTLLYYANTGGRGAVRVVGPIFDHQDYGVAVRLGSPLRKPINEAILSLIEDGTYARIQKTWFGTE